MYGQAITVKTICSRDDFVEKHLDILRVKFSERGYPVQLVETNLERGAALCRENLLNNSVPTVHTKPKFKPVFRSESFSTSCKIN